MTYSSYTIVVDRLVEMKIVARRVIANQTSKKWPPTTIMFSAVFSDGVMVLAYLYNSLASFFGVGNTVFGEERLTSVPVKSSFRIYVYGDK